jgi:4-amino-4-deoxy-L-arabinose transferase-like glycosyltransferase
VRRDLLIVILVVLGLRALFWGMAIQGDDIYYLAGAQYAQTDPAHPHHAEYLFQGRLVSMRGHPHPPLNTWLLAGLLALLGDVREVPFHIAYTLLSLVAAIAMYFLARRWGSQPLWATLLFCAVPAFVVNGASLESDLPLLACWMAAGALFVEAIERREHRWLLAAMIPLALAGLAAYQSVVLTLILWVLTLQRRGLWWAALGAAAMPGVAIFAYQIAESTGGQAPPLAVTAGYFAEYGLQQMAAKLRNAKALMGHLGWMISPLLVLWGFRNRWMLLALPWAFFDWHPLYVVGVAAALGLLTQNSRRYAWWPQIFFAAALALFFAGSARYLLPLAAPLALLTAERYAARPGWLATGFGLHLLLGLGLAWSNAQHWDGYRAFVAQHASEIRAARTWVNGEWGLRFYAESEGALPLERGQAVRPGALVLTSELGYPIPFTAGGGQLAEVARYDIEPTLPLRLIGLGSRSGYSDATAGVRPFDLVWGPVDRVRLERVIERKPTLSYVEMGHAESAAHLLSGVYELEDGKTRWMGRQARILVQPARPMMEVSATVYVPATAKARQITLEWNGVRVAEQAVAGEGLLTLTAPARSVGTEAGVVTVSCDATFMAPGDARELGVVLVGAGLR